MEREGADLRMLALAGAGWCGAGLGRWCGWRSMAIVLVVAALGAMVARRWPQHGRTLAGAVLVLAALAAVTTLRAERVGGGPVAALARDGAVAEVTGTVVADPREVHGRFGDVSIVRLEVRQVHGRGTAYAVAAPTLVI